MNPLELLENAAEALRGLGPLPVLGEKRLLLVGDTHGYPEVSEWALGLAGELSVDAVVFLGDYVDRGPRGVENLELLASRLVEEERPRLYLLRGNHEDLEMNYRYGFYREALRKRGPMYLRVVERLYTCLPVAAKAGEVVLVHGGVPCRQCSSAPEEPVRLWNGAAETLRSIHCSSRARDTYTEPLMRHLLWNDPDGRIEWFAPSVRGPGVYIYGREAWRSFLRANKARLIIRAHEVVDGLHVWLPGGQPLDKISSGEEMSLDELGGSVVTVFSSLYHGMRAGALLLDLEEGVAVAMFYKG